MPSLKMQPQEQEALPLDALSRSPFYRLVRDSLMIVTSLHRGAPLPPVDVLSKERRWVQGKLVEGAVNDPALSFADRTALVDFHGRTLRDHLEDQRGAKRRRISANLL